MTITIAICDSCNREINKLGNYVGLSCPWCGEGTVIETVPTEREREEHDRDELGKDTKDVPFIR